MKLNNTPISYNDNNDEVNRERIFFADGMTHLSSIATSQIHQWLASHGVVVLRGFEACRKSFSQLVQNSSAGVSIDPARRCLHNGIQPVNEGHEAIGMHIENGSTPRIPHVVWFFCSKSAKFGSATTFCDAEQLWNNLTSEVQQLFKNKKIKYTRTVPEPIWKRYLCHELGHRKSIDQLTFKDLQQLVSEGTESRFMPNLDGSIVLEVTVPAVRASQFSPYSAFANSMLGPSQYNENPELTFEDGTPISTDILQHVTEEAEKITQEIEWQTGDIALMDNTRYMHGRRAIIDMQRSIEVAISYLR